MNKIKSLADLKKMKSDLQSQISIRQKSDNPEGRTLIRIGMGTSGIASGAKQIMEFMIDELEKRNVDAIVTQVGDMGYSYADPTVEVTVPGKDPLVFGDVNIKKADDIIEKYIKNGELLDGIIPVNYETIDKK
jgi:NADP-reducing hydrogenase subunit HndB